MLFLNTPTFCAVVVAKLINHSDGRKAFIDSYTYFDPLYYVNFFRIEVVESCLIVTTACGISKPMFYLLKEQFKKKSLFSL